MCPTKKLGVSPRGPPWFRGVPVSFKGTSREETAPTTTRPHTSVHPVLVTDVDVGSDSEPSNLGRLSSPPRRVALGAGSNPRVGSHDDLLTSIGLGSSTGRLPVRKNWERTKK